MAKSGSRAVRAQASVNTSIETSRLERVLAYMVFTTVGLSVLCFLAVIIGTPMKIVQPDTVIWQTIILLPLIGLPIGFVMIITLIVVNATRRSRAAKGAR